MSDSIHAEVVVLGSGPGGYSAAFRAADLGKKVILIERYDVIGGVCLNVGCIPSKALLHVAKVVDDAQDLAAHGVEFGKPKLNVDKIRDYKNGVIKKLTGGLAMMAKQRGVQIMTGEGQFADAKKIIVTKDNKKTEVTFDNCIIAAGSLPVKLPFIPEDPRVIDSTGALELGKTDGELLVLGGGIIGLEMATVYHTLGAKISVVEMMDQLIPGADRDVVVPLHKRLEKRYESIMLKTSVTKVTAAKEGLWVTFDGANAPKENPKRYDRILVAVGRRPNGKLIGADNAGIKVDERGFIPVDKQMKTNVAGIYAIGDIVGNPMLAHKASSEAHVAAEVIAGKKHYFDPKCIPSVAYTDPEIAWVGLTENHAKEKGIQFEKAVFPWMASGRALSVDRTEGFTKLIFDEKHHVIGGAIVGVNAGELISEIALAIEMNCDVEDIALTIHPHPTLSESVKMAAEVFEGTVTDLYLPKKK
ncbi:MAG: dihydrolipoyl dehydrogenase [Gammaproteobacteria bacterium CG_4_10_14_0_8_um_filter_38_16]|nr:MAG: dihydrolipoyl dehydrogenase [Gammaproteobacteria bacterium CG_4_10_14_0_8_um_filter_38_16]PJA03290.1 MAG: dihydrolipoyl dehydrogenase [Gammaproteobacteria bacterium CG_4_10_14_0_2_um_filter_38_22]PJB10335.1 MAG: dihydrolipoyl dehydrogenase [Gammaproteobacteria bacterium CG_4_9_14_3_um_filter_38_9]